MHYSERRYTVGLYRDGQDSKTYEPGRNHEFVLDTLILR